MMENLRNYAYHLLRKSEGLFKTNMVYLTKGGFWLILGQVVSSASAFILAIAFANIFSKEMFGTYKYLLTIVGILTIPTLRYMNVSITQSVAQGNEGTAFAGIKTKIKWGLLGSLAAVTLSGYYFIHHNILLGTLIMISAPFLPFKDPLGAYVAILNGKKDFRKLTLFSSIPTILNIAIMLAILLLTKNIYWVLLSYFIFWTTANFILLKMTFRAHPLNNLVDEKSLTFGKQVSLIGVFAAVAGYFDKLIIFHFLGAASLAIYSIALAPISQINGVMGNVNTLAAPKFSQQDTRALKSSLKIKERRIIPITIFVSLIYILLSKILFGIIFPKYESAVLFSQIMAVSIPLTAISRFRSTAIQSRFDRKSSYLYTSITSVMQIILNLVGVYFFGLMGIVISFVAIGTCQFITTGVLMKNFK